MTGSEVGLYTTTLHTTYHIQQHLMATTTPNAFDTVLDDWKTHIKQYVATNLASVYTDVQREQLTGTLLAESATRRGKFIDTYRTNDTYIMIKNVRFIMNGPAIHAQADVDVFSETENTTFEDTLVATAAFDAGSGTWIPGIPTSVAASLQRKDQRVTEYLVE
jgi:hypothetical protein